MKQPSFQYTLKNEDDHEPPEYHNQKSLSFHVFHQFCEGPNVLFLGKIVDAKLKLLRSSGSFPALRDSRVTQLRDHFAFEVGGIEKTILLSKLLCICAMVKSRFIGDGHPTFNRNPYNGYINPYYWVDDHPLLYGNNGTLDPGTYTFIESVC